MSTAANAPSPSSETAIRCVVERLRIKVWLSRRAVAHAFSRLRHDRLAGMDHQGAVLVVDPERTFEEDGDLLELGRVRFDPTLG